jgi:transglutaminase-like putative cysteine protease
MRFPNQAGCQFLPPLKLTWGKSYPVQSHPIPDGDAGVSRTISWMKALVHGPGGARHIMVRQAALEAARGTERGQDEINSVLGWVKDHIEFRGELGETLQEPAWTLQLGAGDCDCQSMLAAAMLSSLGYETRFRTIALADSPGELSHVYPEVKDRRSGQWISLDSTVARSWPGWQPEEIARAVDYSAMQPTSSKPWWLEGLLAAGTAWAAYSLTK